MAIFPWTLLMTTIWPPRLWTMEGRRAVKEGKKETEISPRHIPIPVDFNYKM